MPLILKERIRRISSSSTRKSFLDINNNIASSHNTLVSDPNVETIDTLVLHTNTNSTNITNSIKISNSSSSISRSLKGKKGLRAIFSYPNNSNDIHIAPHEKESILKQNSKNRSSHRIHGQQHHIKKPKSRIDSLNLQLKHDSNQQRPVQTQLKNKNNPTIPERSSSIQCSSIHHNYSFAFPLSSKSNNIEKKENVSSSVTYVTHLDSSNHSNSQSFPSQSDENINVNGEREIQRERSISHPVSTLHDIQNPSSLSSSSSSSASTHYPTISTLAVPADRAVAILQILNARLNNPKLNEINDPSFLSLPNVHPSTQYQYQHQHHERSETEGKIRSRNASTNTNTSKKSQPHETFQAGKRSRTPMGQR